MSSASSPEPDGAQPAVRRLKLVMTSTEPHDASDITANTEGQVMKQELSRSCSPVRPSYSPVTPTLSHSSATGQDSTESAWIDEPEPLPLSLDENPDAIALQATLSLLQMQRQQSLRDIRGLSRMKQQALENPEAFVQDLKDGKLTKPVQHGIALDQESEGSDGEDEKKLYEADASRFGKLPVGQNIARCPPIEWSKYRVVGEQLDRLHEVQKQYPGVTEDMVMRGVQPRPHEVTAPYRPFTDKLAPTTPSTETRNYNG